MAKTYFQVRYYDRENPDATPIIEPAKKSSVQLSFSGGDDKIQTIIGSTCTAQILDPESLDGKFSYFYTSDETRWRTQIWFVDPDDSSRDRLFWQGHIMPEQYEEPYTSDNLFVKTLATDGLGRLKGKYMDDIYYEQEHSVMDYISHLLELSGNTLDLYFAPAIINKSQPLWHNIYVSGSCFRESEKKETAYKVLESLLENLQCVLYQDWGNWFMVGYNIQPIESYLYHHYIENVYQGEIEITRVPQDVKPVQLDTPTVGIRTPYKEITVTTPIQETAFSEELVEQSRDGWVLPAPLDTLNVGERLLFRRWLVEGYNFTGDATGWTPIVRPKDGKLNIAFPNGVYDETKYLRLDSKLFVVKGQKIKIDFDFEFPLDLGDNVRIRVDFIVDDLNGNSTVVTQEVRFDSDTLPDDTEHEDQLTKEFVVGHNGYLDVRIYKPTATTTVLVLMKLRSLTIEDVDYEEVYTVTNVINEDYSIIEDVDLTLGDDVKGGDCTFRLEKLEDRSVDFYTKDLDIKSVFVFDSVHYVVLDLRELFFVKDYPNNIEVQQGGAGAIVALVIDEVVFNFEQGEQMVFAYDPDVLGFTIATTDVLQCKVKDYVYPVGDREPWQEWYDGVYNLLPKRYADIVGSIRRNLYLDPHLYLDVSLLGIYTFSTLISFNYKGDKTFYPLNITLDLDTGVTRGYYNEAFYGKPITENIPPIVDAGPDQTLTDAQDTASLLAAESDPDGVIVSRLWEVINGTAVITTPTSLATDLTGITSDEVTMQITVTDDDGATASDTMQLLRALDYTLNNTILENTNTVDPETQTVVRKEQLVLAPLVPYGELVTIQHAVTLSKSDDAAGASTSVFFECRKNGQLIAQASDEGTQTFSISYINGDVITYEVSSDSQTGPGLGTTQGSSKVVLSGFSFQTGLGTVTNSPYTVQAQSQVSG